MQTKAAIRERIRKLLHSQPMEEIKQKSAIIEKKLAGLKRYKDSKSIAFYISKFYEVDTFQLLKNIDPKKAVSVPVSNKNIKFVEFHGLQHLVRGKFDVFEPKERIPISYEPDLILAPGIAFDGKRARLGHGLGLYDRLLEKYPNAYKVGLSFDFQIVDEIPCEPHDVHMDIIITEKGVI